MIGRNVGLVSSVGRAPLQAGGGGGGGMGARGRGSSPAPGTLFPP